MAHPRSPRDDKDFKKLWKKYIPRIVARENYTETHLDQLRIFIDMLVEYEELRLDVKQNGISYVNEGRYGIRITERPEVKLKMAKVREIRQFAKQLDIVLAKDNGPSNSDDDDDW